MAGVIRGADRDRHDWLGHAQPVGLVVAPAVLDRLGVAPSPQTREDGEVLGLALAALAAGDPWPLFRDVLGWPVGRVAGAPGGPPLPGDLTVSLRDGETLLVPTYAIGTDLLVRVEPPGIALDRRGAADGWEATPHQRFERHLRETGVTAGVLVGARETGRKDGAVLAPELRLVTVPKGESSGWIPWPLASMTDVAGRAMLGGCKLLLDAHALFTGAPEMRLPALLAESRRAQANVSERLSGQVLAALHELLRGLDAADPALVRDLAARDPHHLYQGLLAVLMRLIFILYAEDRGLMPSRTDGGGAELYERGYALGSLHHQLEENAGREADLTDERRGAWGRLLALFRLVDRGHPSGFMQARGGTLFDERRFPFLLGRTGPDDGDRVLPVSDGCVLRVLAHLMVLGGERLSYRTLDVEEIGSVYEVVMGFTVERAGGPALAIRAGKNNRVPVWVDLPALLAVPAPERARFIKDRTGRGQLPATVGSALKAAGDVAAVEAALLPVADARASPRGAVAAGTPILQPTDERRRTGSHYTPRSLTEPIVAHALAPAFDRIGPDATPAAVLDLKVCDPAVGSGAFLVEACRQLGARLVAAWDKHPTHRPTVPADETDLLHAKRLVAQNCLHGVDHNPMALDLARLSLWLETLARDHQFTFLDAGLRHGDSLVGLPNPKIMAVTWGKPTGQHSFLESLVRERLAEAAEIRRVMRADAEDASYAVQEARHREALIKVERAQLVADAILEAFFSGTGVRDRQARLTAAQDIIFTGGDAGWPALQLLQDRLRASPIGITSFHWELAFDDVFNRPNPGFDAIVGNPPFAGKNTIASGHPLAYPDWLKTLHPGAHGNADLAAHFFRRAFGLLRRGGAFGLVATNTIRQGDTRESGLAAIVAEGGTIIRAVSRHRWEGEAAVVVSLVFVRKDGTRAEPTGPAVLDGREVPRISAYLVEGRLDGSPTKLRENASTSFIGSFLLGMGFTFDDVNAARGKATPLAVMEELIAADPRNAEVIKPYLGGEEINNSPTFEHHRYAIDFFDYPLQRQVCGERWADLDEATRIEQVRAGLVACDYPNPVAADWPKLLGIVRERVKPERNPQSRPALRERWWQYAEKRPGLYAAIAGLRRVIAINCGATPHVSFAVVRNGPVFSHTTAIFALSDYAAFAVLQSRVHEVWARTFASSMKDDLRYTPSDCFETFPFPADYLDHPALEAAGRAYHDHRARLMVAAGQGMTPTYNRFHDPRCDDPAIVELRRLHREMDRAVLAAFGWDDPESPVFLQQGDEDDHAYQGRLFWPAPVRDRVLARLLRLNEERAAAEALLAPTRPSRRPAS